MLLSPKQNIIHARGIECPNTWTGKWLSAIHDPRALLRLPSGRREPPFLPHGRDDGWLVRPCPLWTSSSSGRRGRRIRCPRPRVVFGRFSAAASAAAASGVLARPVIRTVSESGRLARIGASASRTIWALARSSLTSTISFLRCVSEFPSLSLSLSLPPSPPLSFSPFLSPISSWQRWKAHYTGRTCYRLPLFLFFL